MPSRIFDTALTMADLVNIILTFYSGSLEPPHVDVSIAGVDAIQYDFNKTIHHYFGNEFTVKLTESSDENTLLDQKFDQVTVHSDGHIVRLSFPVSQAALGYDHRLQEIIECYDLVTGRPNPRCQTKDILTADDLAKIRAAIDEYTLPVRILHDYRQYFTINKNQPFGDLLIEMVRILPNRWSDVGYYDFTIPIRKEGSNTMGMPRYILLI